MIGEQFRLGTGVDVAHVPYQQLMPAITDLISGTNHYMFIASPAVVDLVAAGRLRALAVTGRSRLASFNEVPTLAEAGYPELSSDNSLGLAARKGTPQPVIEGLNLAINAALESERVRTAFETAGVSASGGTSGSFGSVVVDETRRWAKVIADAGIKTSGP